MSGAFLFFIFLFSHFHISLFSSLAPRTRTGFRVYQSYGLVSFRRNMT